MAGATIPEWRRSVEQIVVSAIERGTRVLGIAGVIGASGVSTLARDLSEGFARSGCKTLLLDFSGKVLPREPGGPWILGGTAAKDFIRSDGRGYDLLMERFTQDTHFRFANPRLLR